MRTRFEGAMVVLTELLRRIIYMAFSRNSHGVHVRMTKHRRREEFCHKVVIGHATNFSNVGKYSTDFLCCMMTRIDTVNRFKIN